MSLSFYISLWIIFGIIGTFLGFCVDYFEKDKYLEIRVEDIAGSVLLILLGGITFLIFIISSGVFLYNTIIKYEKPLFSIGVKPNKNNCK